MKFRNIWFLKNYKPLQFFFFKSWTIWSRLNDLILGEAFRSWNICRIYLRMMSNSGLSTPTPSVLSVCDNLIKITLFIVNYHPNMTPIIHLEAKLGFSVAKLALEGKMSISVSVDLLRDNWCFDVLWEIIQKYNSRDIK